MVVYASKDGEEGRRGRTKHGLKSPYIRASSPFSIVCLRRNQEGVCNWVVTLQKSALYILDMTNVNNGRPITYVLLYEHTAKCIINQIWRTSHES